MVVAVDAMGGDHAPAEIVAGALRALKDLGLKSILVGQGDKVAACLKEQGGEGRIPIFHAPEVIGMDESPMKAVRTKRNSSICQAVALVKKGQAQAVVSAGNTGAVMAAAVFGLGRIKGIERPALGSVFPSPFGPVLVVDVGANVDSQPRHLFQFAVMGDIYARTVLGHDNPRVGLMSIGEEDAKGNREVRQAHDLLEQSGLNFIGNVEGRDIFAGKAEIIVCDGFVGNVVLKLTEGVVYALTVALKKELRQTRFALLGGLLLRGAFRRFDKKYNYAEYGGAPLLGVRGACLIGHGASNSRAVMNAIRVASEWAGQGFNDKLETELARYGEIRPQVNGEAGLRQAGG